MSPEDVFVSDKSSGDGQKWSVLCIRAKVKKKKIFFGEVYYA